MCRGGGRSRTISSRRDAGSGAVQGDRRPTCQKRETAQCAPGLASFVDAGSSVTTSTSSGRPRRRAARNGVSRTAPRLPASPPPGPHSLSERVRRDVRGGGPVAAGRGSRTASMVSICGHAEESPTSGDGEQSDEPPASRSIACSGLVDRPRAVSLYACRPMDRILVFSRVNICVPMCCCTAGVGDRLI